LGLEITTAKSFHLGLLNQLGVPYRTSTKPLSFLQLTQEKTKNKEDLCNFQVQSELVFLPNGFTTFSDPKGLPGGSQSLRGCGCDPVLQRKIRDRP